MQFGLNPVLGSACKCAIAVYIWLMMSTLQCCMPSCSCSQLAHSSRCSAGRGAVIRHWIAGRAAVMHAAAVVLSGHACCRQIKVARALVRWLPAGVVARWRPRHWRAGRRRRRWKPRGCCIMIATCRGIRCAASLACPAVVHHRWPHARAAGRAGRAGAVVHHDLLLVSSVSTCSGDLSSIALTP